MADSNQDIKQRLLATFRVEAQEHLQAIASNLLALDRGLPSPEAHEVVEATFREMHTLKGAARSVSLMDVEAICQALESVLSGMSRGKVSLTRPLLDLLHDTAAGVGRLLAGGKDPAARDLIRRLEHVVGEPEAEGPEAGPGPEVGGRRSETMGQETAAEPAGPVVPPADTIRVAAAKLDALLLQAEDLLVPKLAAGERIRGARALVEALARCRKTISRRSAVGGRRSGANATMPPTLDDRGDTLSAVEQELRALEVQARELLGHLARDQRMIVGAVDGIQGELWRLRLTSASTVLNLFPPMVRDLARVNGKEVELVVRGADLELDRRVLEAVKEPLIHLVRNAVDHGIEPPAGRGQAGKPPAGRLTVSIVPVEGGRIEVSVVDDGRGVDLARVREGAVRARLLNPEEARALPDEAALDLIYRSGLSTSPVITGVSGHGLGLAIAKERVERLGGRIHLETQAGTGTTVRMILPASIATFHGLLIRAGGQSFLLPVDSVECGVRIAPEQIRTVEGREAFRWNGHPLSLARLDAILGLPAEENPTADRRPPTAEHGTEARGLRTEGPNAESFRIPQSSIPNPQSPPVPYHLGVVLRSGDDRAVVLVEDILGDREVLVKELRPPLARVRNVAAAGLLETGQVVLILRPADLFKSFRQAPRPRAAPAERPERKRPGAILVVDDSITTRTMEKNMLEAAGYRARVAADGMEAWAALKSEDFDLVVSDVDMPRMNGFDLTARIRADRKLADVPVVLVTVLEAREDKERGIEVGANAYVVKSSFDQSNLLEIIRRLL